MAPMSLLVLCAALLQEDGVRQVAEKALPSVVVVSFSGRDGGEKGMGTGFVVSPDGLIATNLHVIGEARPITVQFRDGRSYEVKEVHASERAVDLAVLRIDAKDLPALPLAEGDPPAQGTPVVAIGNPEGLKHSVVSGVVSARRTIDDMPVLQLAIPVERGNSGGPVLDLEGRVRGILAMKAATENIGFAIEVAALRPLLEKPNPVPMSKWLTIGRLDAREWAVKYGARWTQRAGRIAVSGPGTGFGGRALCLATTPAPALPYEAAVTVRLHHDDGAAGILFAGDGGDRHYGFYPTSGSMRLTRFDGPTVYEWNILRTVESPHYRPGDWNTLRVRVEEKRLRCYVNDQLVIESDDTTYRTREVGLAKFRHTDADFRGFRAAARIAPAAVPAETAKKVGALAEELPETGEIPDALLDRILRESPDAPRILRKRAEWLERRSHRLREAARLAHARRVSAEIAAALDKNDLLRAALLVARLDNEEVDVDAYLREVDRMAADARASLPEGATETARAEALDRHFFRELLFHGSRTDYYNRSNSYLNEVIDDREGLPIALSVLYMELGRRLDLRIRGIPLPGHFVVRHEPPEGKPRLIDVFNGGKAMSRDEARDWVRQWADEGATEEELETLLGESLEPATNRAIVARMLANLFGSAEDEDARLRYAGATLAFLPDDARMRAQRVQICLRTDRYRLALVDVEWFLEKKPEGVDEARLEQLKEELRRRIGG